MGGKSRKSGSVSKKLIQRLVKQHGKKKAEQKGRPPLTDDHAGNDSSTDKTNEQGLGFGF